MCTYEGRGKRGRREGKERRKERRREGKERKEGM